MLAGLTRDQPQQVPRIVVFGVSRKNLPVNRLCLAQSAPTVMLNSDSQGVGDRRHGYRTINKGMPGAVIVSSPVATEKRGTTIGA